METQKDINEIINEIDEEEHINFLVAQYLNEEQCFITFSSCNDCGVCYFNNKDFKVWEEHYMNYLCGL